jgi:aminoglycoside 6'-N-acetyltransferase
MREPQTPLTGRLTVVRPATPADADRLVAWHTDPGVAEFWDDEMFTHEELLVRLARPDVDAYIIEADADPVGYLQAWFDNTVDECGIDMFLVPEARDRGLGPDAARTLVTYLLRVAGQRRITVDPYLWNSRAVRAWHKAGFRLVEEREPDEDHAHPWLLMTLDSDSLDRQT